MRATISGGHRPRRPGSATPGLDGPADHQAADNDST
jgi:hypothetical protein